MKDSKILFSVITVILAVIVIFTLVQNSRLKRENDKVQNYFNQTLEALNEIQDSLSEIDTKDLIIHRMAVNPEVNDSLSNAKDRIMSSIQSINDYIALNKERLSNIEQTLKEKNLESKGLQRIINNLKKNIAEKEAMISTLSKQLDDLKIKVEAERKEYEVQISQKSETIQEQEQTIGQQEETINTQTTQIKNQEDEMNTIYFIAASKNELIEKGFLTKGGLFSSAKRSSRYNEEQMNSFNLVKFSEIVIKAKLKNIIVLSDQNKSSYLLEDKGNETILTITNPKEFRKVKYLIIQTN